MISPQRTMAAVMMLATGALCSAAQEKTAPEKGAAQGTTGKHYVLPANPETTQWGWLDPAEKPKATLCRLKLFLIRWARSSRASPSTRS